MRAFSSKRAGPKFREGRNAIVDGSGSSGGNSRVQEDLHCLRNKLLHLTVTKAREGSQFYNKLYSKSKLGPDTVIRLGDLAKLPIVRKEDIVRAGIGARCDVDGGKVALVQHTSGTTGEPFFFYRSPSEVRFIGEFFSDLQQTCRRPGPKPLMLVLSGVDWHGTPTPVPGNAFPIHCGLHSEEYLELAVHLLGRTFDIPEVNQRINVLTGSNELLMFTNWCLERGLNCGEEFEVERIQITGIYLTERWRRRLEEVWQAPVTDRYTISEHFGGATYVPSQRGFCFDPHIAYELVDFSGQPAEDESPGILLLTSLFPFVQMQPLIRYWTGDVFARSAADADGVPIFRFLGRERQALFHPAHPAELLLTGVDVIEAVDGYPEVARTVTFAGYPLKYLSADGDPICRGYVSSSADSFDLLLKIESAVPLHLFPDRQKELGELIRTDLLRRSSRLKALVENGDAELRVVLVSPGELAGARPNMGIDAARLWQRVSPEARPH